VRADTAAVLLTDESGTELVARAARGLQGEVHQGVRVPIGTGFAGHIASERRPIRIDRVDDGTVLNPILWETGVKAMLGVPLLHGDTVIGVLHVGSLGGRVFDEEDAVVLQVAGERIATAIRLRLLESERSAAEALQRSLLPSTPSRLGDLEFAARYVPAEHGGIGGDWFDVFRVEDGTIWLVTGDVAGHGLRAAVVMGRVRSALRSYALLGDDPGQVLAMTDRKVQHFEVGHMVTVAAAIVRPPYDELHLALAGHPPPVLAHPDREASLVDADPGPPLGAALEGDAWPVATVPLQPGSVVAFYTDGLVERRHEDIDEGLERLRQAVRASEPGQVCRTVMSSLIGDHAPSDDVALLAVRRSPA
jgi:serine phosphatase RsbU (regulator of sigma subunit)